MLQSEPPSTKSSLTALLKLSAGEVLDESDRAVMATAITRMLLGEEWEAALAIGWGWRATVRSLFAESVELAAPSGDMTRAAQALIKQLARYLSSGRFDRQLCNPLDPRGEDDDLFRLMVRFKGKLPSLRTVQAMFVADANASCKTPP